MLICGWVGMGGNSYLPRGIKPIIEELGMKLVIISEHDDADVKWDRNTYLQEMLKFDIIICPQNVELQPAKSCVKVITAMSVAKPIICSPLPSYLEVVQEGVNGLIAASPQEWRSKLELLRDNQELRNKLSANALITSKEFSANSIATKWKNLLQMALSKKVAFINNTLPQKYMSYGDKVLEILRTAGSAVYEEYRYEDIDSLPQEDCDMQIFIEVRYDTEDLIYPIQVPRVLITQENLNINHLPHFNVIVTPNKQLAEKWQQRGFVNVHWVPTLEVLSYQLLKNFLDEDITPKRQAHNLVLHDAHINAFHHLIPPEERWANGERDKAHINYTMEHTKSGDRVLDVGSADGWLALYLATQDRYVSALEFVPRGMEWTLEHAKRLGVSIDLRKGFFENVDEVFSNARFNTILIFELLEHVDFFRIPWYLNKVEKLLKPGGNVLISLPLQDLRDNSEHLFSPSEKLIKKAFQGKQNLTINWTDIPNHGVPGVWFGEYSI